MDMLWWLATQLNSTQLKCRGEKRMAWGFLFPLGILDALIVQRFFSFSLEAGHEPNS